MEGTTEKIIIIYASITTMRATSFITLVLAAPAAHALLPTATALARGPSSTRSACRLPPSLAAVSVGGGEDVSNGKLARNLAGAYLGAFLFGN